jgi:hypothetical protein
MRGTFNTHSSNPDGRRRAIQEDSRISQQFPPWKRKCFIEIYDSTIRAMELILFRSNPRRPEVAATA